MKSIQQKIDEELQKIKELPIVPIIEDDNIDTISLGDDNIFGTDDLSTYTLKDEDWAIQPLDIANVAPLLNSITLNGLGGTSTLNTGTTATYTIGAGGAGAYQSIYNTGGSTYAWANPLNQNKVHITGAGIEMDADADITIGGRSLKKMFETIEQRLAILVPDPKKLEHYEALKQAYEHYKTLEALCNEEPKKDQQ